MVEKVYIYIDGEPRRVPAWVPDRWTAHRVLGIPRGHTFRLETESKLPDTDRGWRFLSGARYVTVDPFTVFERSLDDSDELRPWEQSPDFWKTL